MQCAGYLFLQRKWEADKKIILRCLTYFRKLGYKPQVKNEFFIYSYNIIIRTLICILSGVDRLLSISHSLF